MSTHHVYAVSLEDTNTGDVLYFERVTARTDGKDNPFDVAMRKLWKAAADRHAGDLDEVDRYEGKHIYAADVYDDEGNCRREMTGSVELEETFTI